MDGGRVMSILGNYELGTVATATVRGQSSYRVMLVASPYGPVWVHSEIDGVNVSDLDEVTDVHPLTVLDFGPGRGPAATAVEYVSEIAGRFVKESSERTFFGWLANEIERQATAQPRMDEPLRIGSVVKASQVGEVDGSDRLWTRFRNGLGEVWIDGLQHVRKWDDLDNPRLHRSDS